MTPPRQNDSVLVVDDEPDIVALVAFHLLKAGYRVVTANTGQDALDQVRRERPSLIVLDLMLPGISGFDVLEQLRADERGCVDVDGASRRARSHPRLVTGRR